MSISLKEDQKPQMSNQKIDDLTLAKAAHLVIINMVEQAYLTRLGDLSRKGLLESERLRMKEIQSERELKSRFDEVLTELANEVRRIDPDFSDELLQKLNGTS